VPDVYKDYLGARQIALPTPRTGGGPVLSAVLVEPLGTGKPADVGLVSDLLYCSFGKTGTVRLPVLGDSLLKAVPSGGARHPTEAYLYNFSIKGLPKGLFHYSVRGHSLEVLREGDFDSEVMETVFELRDSVKFACRAVVFVTSRFERNMWRYREPRTFRTIFFDMGHAVQNLVFAARAAGRRSYVGYGYDVERLERLIGIDGLREGVFYFAAIG
jgi:SagB-type dehydrogenase family enzyme